MAKRRISLIIYVFFFALADTCIGQTEYTYIIDCNTDHSGSTCSVDPNVGFDPMSTTGMVYLGTWSNVTDGIGWTWFDVNDYAAEPNAQYITKVLLRLNVEGIGAPHPMCGMRVHRVEDDGWTASTIHHNWPVSSDWEVVFGQEGTDPNWGVGEHIVDVTEWFNGCPGRESQTGGEPLSIRHTRIPEDWGAMRFYSLSDQAYLTITTTEGTLPTPTGCPCPASPTNVNFDGGGDGYSYDDSDNWDGTCVPYHDNRAYIGGTYDVNVDGEWEVGRLFLGSSGGADANLDLLSGAQLFTADPASSFGTCYVGQSGGNGTINMYAGSSWDMGDMGGTGAAFGAGAGSVGTLNMYGGSLLNIGVTLGAGSIGADGIGIWNMEGGTANLAGLYLCNAGPDDYNSVGHLQLNNGTIETAMFSMAPWRGKATIDILSGTLIIAGDVSSQVNGYVEDGWITSYGGTGPGGLHPRAVKVEVIGANTVVTPATSADLAKAYDPIVRRAYGIENVSWSPGNDANQHDIYFDTNEANVTDANLANQLGVYKGRQGLDANTYPTSGRIGLALNTTYYWRIDEVNGANIIPGEVWTFSTNDGKARQENPEDSENNVTPEADLSWVYGDLVLPDEQNLYFGTDPCATNNPNTIRTEPNFDPGFMAYNATYYWQVDGKLSDGNTVDGNQWSFTTAGYLVVEDFERYANTNDLSYYDEDGPCEDNHWQAGNSEPNTYGYLSTAISLVPAYAMQIEYDLSPSNYAYIRYVYCKDQDFTRGGVKALGLSFLGDDAEGNNVHDMYFVLGDADNDFSIVYYPDVNDLNDGEWYNWDIDLEDFNNNNVDLKRIRKLFIGFGDWHNPVISGKGTVTIDNIRLYPPRCVVEYGPLADISGDCVVDYRDLKMMADLWLVDTTVHTTFTATRTIMGVTASGCGTGFCLTGGMLYIGGPWSNFCNYADDMVAWTRWDVPDFSAMELPKTITKAELKIHVLGYAYGPPLPGLQLDRVDDTWNSTTIHSGWPVTGDMVINRQPGFDGEAISDISFWYGAGKESLTGGEPLSVRFTDPPYTNAQRIPDWGLNLILTLTTGFSDADLNKDDLVNFEDYALLVDSWLEEKLWPQSP